jgi:uncharacterized membrane protein
MSPTTQVAHDITVVGRGREAAMPKIEHSLEVARPVAEVWDLWSDVRRLPELSKSTAAVHDAPERLTAVGQTFRQTVVAAGKRVETEWRVVDIVPLDHLTIEGTPVRGTHVTLVEKVRETAPGRTCCTLTIEYKLPFGPLGRLAGKLGIETLANREAHEVLQGVVRLAEAEQPAVATTT